MPVYYIMLRLTLPLWAVILIIIVLLIGWKIIKFALKVLILVIIILLAFAVVHILHII